MFLLQNYQYYYNDFRDKFLLFHIGTNFHYFTLKLISIIYLLQYLFWNSEIINFVLSIGVGFGLIYVPAVIAVGFYFERWRALATGIAVCGSGIGTSLMAPLSSYLIEKYTWRVALVIQAGAYTCII
jgi:hypothetical protein